MEQVAANQAPVEGPLLKNMIDLGTEATWSSSNLNFRGAGEQVLEDQAVVDDPLLKDRAAVEAPSLKDLIDLGAEDNHGLCNFVLNSGGAGGRDTHDLWFTQDTHLLQYTGFLLPPDLPSLPESDNKDPPTYVPTPLKFSTYSPGYATSPPQIHPSSYSYAPSSPRYTSSSPSDAPTLPKFSIFRLGHASSPLQPNSTGNQVTQGTQGALPDKPKQPPFDTGYDDLSPNRSIIKSRSDNIRPESLVTVDENPRGHTRRDFPVATCSTGVTTKAGGHPVKVMGQSRSSSSSRVEVEGLPLDQVHTRRGALLVSAAILLSPRAPRRGGGG